LEQIFTRRTKRQKNTKLEHGQFHKIVRRNPQRPKSKTLMSVGKRLEKNRQPKPKLQGQKKFRLLFENLPKNQKTLQFRLPRKPAFRALEKPSSPTPIHDQSLPTRPTRPHLLPRTIKTSSVNGFQPSLQILSTQPPGTPILGLYRLS